MKYIVVQWNILLELSLGRCVKCMKNFFHEPFHNISWSPLTNPDEIYNPRSKGNLSAYDIAIE